MLPFKKETLLALCLAATVSVPQWAHAEVDNIVLVHGLNMDGGAWRSVYDELVDRDFNVSVVQMPMTSVKDDIDAVRRTISAQDGPSVLVGHSYGGMVISQAGIDPSVKGLVYVAAFQPEIGESLGALNTSVPADLPAEAIEVFEDGYYVVEPNAWIANVANGASDEDAAFTANFQAAANTSIFGYEAEVAAWKEKSSWAIVANEDRTISPELQRQMAERSGAEITEINGGHLVHMSNPSDIAEIIESAAKQSN